MSFNDKASIPLASAAKFNVPATALDDGSAVYGTVVNAGSSCWVAGNTLKGRKLLVVVQVSGALTGAPTGLLVGVYKGTSSSGAGGAVVTGTTTEFATPAANTTYLAEIDCSYLTYNGTDFYSLGLSLNGAGTTALTASAVALVLEPDHC